MAEKPSAAARLADRWLSKKLGITGGAIGVLSQLGISPDLAGYLIAGLAAVFVVVQGIVDYKTGNVQGVIEGLKSTLVEAGVLKPEKTDG